MSAPLPPPHPITTQDALSAACARLSAAPHLAVDTEFIRDRTYYAQLCLVQVASEDEAILIDPLALDDLTPLRTLLMRTESVKIFHAGRHDLEIFHDAWGVLPAPVFDTQLAATLLGHPAQTSYARLVADILDVQLDKAGTLTDWARRPLTPDQLRYAADDVIHLVRLFPKMRAMLMDQGRLAWLDAEHAALVEADSYLTDPLTAWRQVKAAGTLRGPQRATLKELAAFREEEARLRNLPRRWVLPDESLVELSRRRPRVLDDLRAVRGVPAALIERRGDDILARVARADKAVDDTSTDMAPRLSSAQEVIVDLLGTLVRLRAQERDVAPTQLATRAQLERVAAEGEFADVSVLSGWRREVVGDDLLALREGRLRLVVKDGVAIVESAEDAG